MLERFFVKRKLTHYIVLTATSLINTAFATGDHSGIKFIVNDEKTSSNLNNPSPKEINIPREKLSRDESNFPSETVKVSPERSTSPKEALLLRRIAEYWKDGDYAIVKKQVIDFLLKNPDTPLRDQLHSMLGDLYFQERNFRQALGTYELIEDAGIREKTFFNHLQAHFEVGDYLPVIEKGENYLKENRKSSAVTTLKVRYLLAEACFRLSLNCNDLEKKVFYLKQAKPHYKILTQTSYSDRALFPLAEIHRLLREDDRAAALYLTLADKHPEHKERFLFQAAILQIKENKFEAINTFFKIHEMGGKRSRLAAFNGLILMYQTQQYRDFLSFHKDVIALMPEQKVPLLTFYEGRCHYALGDYQGAVVALENFVATAKEKSKDLKTAFLLLVNCSRHLKDIPLLDRTLYSFETSFPRDFETAKVLMLHAQMCRETGNFGQALTDFKTLINNYPDHQTAEEAQYDCALLLSQMDQWEEAREMFFSFLSKYPESEKKTTAWRHLLNCSVEELRNPNQADPEKAKMSFVTVLTGALENKDVLSKKERDQYILAMMKCKCELGQYEETVPMISQYISDVADRGLLAEAHLLMAICQKNLSSDLSTFIHHAETALQNNPRLAENHILHLELYNAYLTKGLAEEMNRDFFYELSAEHLFASGAWREKSIKLDNYLWLTNYFYQQTLKGNNEDFEKASLLYNNLLSEEALNISSESLYLEPEVLKFAQLLELKNQRKEQVALLEKLASRQEEQPELAWKLKRRTLLELARAYEANGQLENALRSYQDLTKTAEKNPSIVTNTAQLHLANLKYNLLNPMERTGENPEIISILHTLKDLQIQKKLLSEPLHLEAALRYAEIRCNMAAPEKSSKASHFFYKRMYDDFHNNTDPITEEYNLLRQSHPEKDAIYTAYMRYLELQMLKCEAELARAAKKPKKAAECKNQALQIANSLMENKDYLQPYLLDRIKRIKVEITKEL